MKKINLIFYSYVSTGCYMLLGLWLFGLVAIFTFLMISPFVDFFPAQPMTGILIKGNFSSMRNIYLYDDGMLYPSNYLKYGLCDINKDWTYEDASVQFGNLKILNSNSNSERFDMLYDALILTLNNQIGHLNEREFLFDFLSNKKSITILQIDRENIKYRQNIQFSTKDGVSKLEYFNFHGEIFSDKEPYFIHLELQYKAESLKKFLKLRGENYLK